MNKRLTLVLCLFATTLFAAESHPVFVNGKPFGNAVKVNGVRALPLEDLSKHAGSNVSLEPCFSIRGNALVATPPHPTAAANKKSTTAASDIFAKIGDIKGESTDDKHKDQLQSVVHVLRNGVISNNLPRSEGKVYVPLADVAKSLGVANWAGPVTLAAGQPLNLNSTKSPNALLGN